jgi:metalloendopeptidase OMA1, mitochondrial
MNKTNTCQIVSCFTMYKRGVKWMLLTLAMFSTAIQTGCSVNPMTGRSRLILVSPAEEEQIGLVAWQKLIRRLEPHFTKDPVIVKQVEKVINRVISAAIHSKIDDIAQQAKRYDWEYAVVNSQEINAYCLPGGKILVSTGILSVAQNEAGLAAIIGHEVAHALAHHSAERTSQTSLIQLGMAGVGLALGLKHVRYEKQEAIMGLLAFGAEYGLILPFSREHEIEADQMGLMLAAQAGFDPRESIRVWERMEAKAPTSQMEFQSTHPSHGTRIQQLTERMPEALAYYQGALIEQMRAETLLSRDTMAVLNSQSFIPIRNTKGKRSKSRHSYLIRRLSSSGKPDVLNTISARAPTFQ